MNRITFRVAMILTAPFIFTLLVFSTPSFATATTAQCFDGETGAPVNQIPAVSVSKLGGQWDRVHVTIVGRLTRIAQIAQNEPLTNETGDAEYSEAVAKPYADLYVPEETGRVYAVVASFLESPYNNADSIGCIITIAVGDADTVSPVNPGSMMWDSKTGKSVTLGLFGF